METIGKGLPDTVSDAFVDLAALHDKNAELQEENEELRDQVEQMAETMNGLLHDFNNGLTAAQGFVGLARLQVRTIATAELIEHAELAIASLARLVSDVQLRALLGQGGLKPREHVIDVPKLLRDTVRGHRLSATEKGLSLSCRISPLCPQHVLGDEVLLVRILDNLVHNAIKYTPAGQVCIRVHKNRKRESIIFGVADTGIGVGEEDQTRIFRMFQRAADKSMPSAHGFGIGLKNVVDFVELLRGEIKLKSMIGRGSVFRVELPFPEAPP